MKSKLITAVLASLVACISLPALSQNASDTEANAVSASSSLSTLPAPRTTAYQTYQDNYAAAPQPYQPLADLDEDTTMEEPTAPVAPAKVTHVTYKPSIVSLAPMPKFADVPYQSNQLVPDAAIANDDPMPMTQPDYHPAAPQGDPDSMTPMNPTTPADQSNPAVEQMSAPTADPMMTSPTEPIPSPAIDQTSTTSTDSSKIVGVKPFSAEANYMSLAGDLRYQTYANSGVWMSREDAVAAADNQLNAASR